MKEWLEHNHEKIIYGLAAIAALLLIVLFSVRNSMSGDIARLSEANNALEAAAAKNAEELEERGSEIENLKRDLDGSKAEINRLAAENGEMTSQIASLDASLGGERKKAARLADAAAIRREVMENMRNDIAELRRAKRDAEERNKELELEKSSSDAKIRKFGESLKIYEGPARAEDALPSVSGSEPAIVVTLSDASFLRTLSRAVSLAFTKLSGMDAGEDDFRQLSSVISLFEEFTASAREASLLFIPSDDPDVYFSLFADEDKFDKFIESLSAADLDPLVLERRSVLFAADAWGLLEGPDREPLFYIAKRPAGGKTLVLMARSEDAIAEMFMASAGVSPRFEVLRATSGPNYWQMKFPDGFKVGDWLDLFSFDYDLRDIMSSFYGNKEQVLWTVSEFSWTSSGNIVSFEGYSDVMKQNPKLFPAKNIPGRQAEIFGKGDLAYYVSFDAGFLLNCVFLGDETAKDAFFGYLGRNLASDDFLSEDELRRIVTDSRLSIVCVADGGDVSAAYVMLENEAEKIIDKIFSFAEPFEGTEVGIPGWRSALTWPSPAPGIPAAAAAKSGGRFLLGFGDEESLSNVLDIPDSYKTYVSGDNIMSAVVSSGFLDAVLGLMDKDAPEENDALFKRFYSSLAELRDSFEVIRASAGDAETGKGEIVLKEGGDLLGAYIELLGISVMMMNMR
ncbi:MAG: hypothetical protein LBS53_05750 [Synergistaceae bacterium]|nr:hypothetical protein [Synergistaceae bacterium]